MVLYYFEVCCAVVQRNRTHSTYEVHTYCKLVPHNNIEGLAHMSESRENLVFVFLLSQNPVQPANSSNA